jgi:hypothetical protein
MEPLGEPVPQDPNQINPTSIYKVGAFATASTEVTGNATSTAMCDQQDSTLSGSYGIANTPVLLQIVFQKYGMDGLHLSGSSMGKDVVTIRTFVNCFDNPTLR